MHLCLFLFLCFLPTVGGWMLHFLYNRTTSNRRQKISCVHLDGGFTCLMWRDTTANSTHTSSLPPARYMIVVRIIYTSLQMLSIPPLCSLHLPLMLCYSEVKPPSSFHDYNPLTSLQQFSVQYQYCLTPFAVG